MRSVPSPIAPRAPAEHFSQFFGQSLPQDKSTLRSVIRSLTAIGWKAMF
jgi:hypothetical protein